MLRPQSTWSAKWVTKAVEPHDVRERSSGHCRAPSSRSTVKEVPLLCWNLGNNLSANLTFSAPGVVACMLLFLDPTLTSALQ
jgi:hypothetical protein